MDQQAGNRKTSSNRRWFGLCFEWGLDTLYDFRAINTR